MLYACQHGVILDSGAEEGNTHMPDTSSAPHRHHETWRVHGDLADPCPRGGPLVDSGVDPLDGTWFDAEGCPVDTPLVLLIPVPR